MIDLWLACRRAGSGWGGTPLPMNGSPGRQPAALMDAFRILDDLASKDEGDG
ncbi:MAG: hypothetical protein QHC65_16295 [Sphingomonas sp.]|nr:hypothetical protein [Sphingomonas sp.]MDX3885985.1 hypothetical protein [Sphingomonas sp.]